MKKYIYPTLFFINIIGWIIVIIHSVLMIKYGQFFEFSFITSKTIFNLRLFLNLFILVFWVLMMRTWYKHDKKPYRFFLIFFLLGVYQLFYYRKALKNNWI